MYTYYKIRMKDEIIMAIKINSPSPKLLNFCSLTRIKWLWRKQLKSGNEVYSPKELKSYQEHYRTGLIKTILDENFVLVNITTGEVIKPSTVKIEDIIEKIVDELPF